MPATNVQIENHELFGQILLKKPQYNMSRNFFQWDWFISCLRTNRY